MHAFFGIYVISPHNSSLSLCDRNCVRWTSRNSAPTRPEFSRQTNLLGFRYKLCESSIYTHRLCLRSECSYWLHTVFAPSCGLHYFPQAVRLLSHLPLHTNKCTEVIYYLNSVLIIHIKTLYSFVTPTCFDTLCVIIRVHTLFLAKITDW
jgi:hypothetical protein